MKIYDTISLPDKRQMFVVMEYCDGGNLLQWIKRSRRHKLLNQLVSEKCLRMCACVYVSIMEQFNVMQPLIKCPAFRDLEHAV